MFYQDNSDYMRDALYYSTPQNATYQYGYVPNTGQGMYGQNSFGSNMMPMNNYNYARQTQPISTMYPQVYKIINPVAGRIVANSNYQYLTEDALNNMVDTVFNIVEGDVSSLLNTETAVTTSTATTTASGDDTVTQGPSRSGNGGGNNTLNNTANSPIRPPSNTINTNVGVNQLLKDLIKIIILKQITCYPGYNPQPRFV